MIVKGRWKIYMGLKRIEFGAYAMVYVGTKNTMKINRVPEITLDGSNETVVLYLMYLYTDNIMHGYI